MEEYNSKEIESPTSFQIAWQENKKFVYFGVVVYFVLLLSILLTQANRFYSESRNISFLSIYTTYFRPAFDCSLEYDPTIIFNDSCINTYYIIGVIIPISGTALIVSFLSRDRAAGELTSIFSLVF